MINVSLILSGQTAQNLSVAEGTTIQALLTQQGIQNVESITYNGMPNTPTSQVLTEGSSIFVTRSNKGGRD